MYINPGYTVGIVPVHPTGTNGTMFTECCGCAICDDQRLCPSCKREVVGHDAESNHERDRVRWNNATRHWKRRY